MNFISTIPVYRFRRLTVMIASLASSLIAHGAELFYIGAFTDGSSKGIYSSYLDTSTGKLSAPVLALETENPAFLAVAPGGQFVYACNESKVFQGQPTGGVTAATALGDGSKLQMLNQVSSGGPGPCHISLDASAAKVLVANYMGGSISSYTIDSEGKIQPAASFIQHAGSGPVPVRQETAHAHHIVTSPSGRYVFATDLGIDRVKVYTIDSAAKLMAVPERDIILKAGTGPRRILFNRKGDRIYVLGEIVSDMTVYKYDEASGKTSLLQNVSLLAKDWKGESTAAEMQLDASGRFFYASNRGEDSIVVFSVDGEGRLHFVQRIASGGKTPRDFVLDPSGAYLVAANQGTGNIVTFKVDAATGQLTSIPGSIQVDKAVALAFAKVN